MVVGTNRRGCDGDSKKYRCDDRIDGYLRACLHGVWRGRPHGDASTDSDVGSDRNAGPDSDAHVGARRTDTDAPAADTDACAYARTYGYNRTPCNWRRSTKFAAGSQYYAGWAAFDGRRWGIYSGSTQSKTVINTV